MNRQRTPLLLGLIASSLLVPAFARTNEIVEDKIIIDATTNQINVILSDEELAARKAAWQQPELKVSKGLLYRYAKTVKSAAEGCVTDEF